MDISSVFTLFVIVNACLAIPQFPYDQWNYGQFSRENYDSFSPYSYDQFSQRNFDSNQLSQSNFDQFNNRQQQQTTPSPTLQSTRPPTPRFYSCVSNCPTTGEYNPVCGSDNQPYHNQYRLRCNNECGRIIDPNWTTITILRQGICQPRLARA